MSPLPARMLRVPDGTGDIVADRLGAIRPGDERLAVHVSPSLGDALRAIAATNARTVAGEVRLALTQHVRCELEARA